MTLQEGMKVEQLNFCQNALKLAKAWQQVDMGIICI